MGARGPIPNSSRDLSRERDANRGDRGPITVGTRRPVVIPEPDKDWHPIAIRLYEAARNSGQADFYQESDWAILWSLCEDLSMYKKPLINRDGEEYYKRSGQMLQTIMSGLTTLLLTEGDRRRVRLELMEPEERDEDAEVIKLRAVEDMAADF